MNIVSRIIRRIKKEFFYKPGPLELIRNLPRYTDGEIDLDGVHFYFPDANSFVFTYEEIFKGRIYEFETNSIRPVIIDCGANIGVSTLYFRKLYPSARILAFEPDKSIFDFLGRNLAPYKSSDLELINKGVWSSDGELEFFSEGADAGSVVNEAMNSSSGDNARVQVTRLSQYINGEVDFLKLDIEGAETEVLKEIEEKLPLVKNVFIEYHSFAGKEQQLDSILAILARNGFRYYIYAPSPLRKIPFVDRNTFLSIDCLLNICAHR